MATVRDQEIAILRRMNNFFAEDHFTHPAVPTSAAQPAELDAKAWDSLRADPAAIGFDYP
nr:hypothetical protein [Tanacetum cinerariifolium]